MIKVCHMTSAHAPEDVRIFHKECVSLAKAGYDVYLVERGDSYEKSGVHIVGVGQPSGGRLSRMTAFAKKVYQTALAIDADVYQLHDPELLPYGLKLKRKGKRVVFDSHEKYTEQLKRKPYLPGWCTRVIAKAYGVYEAYVLKRIDGVIFPCLKEGKHPFAGMCSHIAVVNNVPRLEEFYDRYDESIPKYERSIVHIGSLTHTRGITHMVKAVGKLDCTAYLGGTFSPVSYRDEVEALPGFSHVRYLGQLNRPKVLETLQRCQIGMAALLNVGQYNQYDNLATKVYEYMSLGLPVVLTRAPYNEKVMEQYRFGICVDPENVDEIAAAISYLLDHPEEARQMGENGRRAVKEEFNWGVEEHRLLNLYEALLAVPEELRVPSADNSSSVEKQMAPPQGHSM